MIKKIILIVLTSLPFLTFANNTYTVDVAKKSAQSQSGYDRHGNQSTECKYRAYRLATNDDSYVSFNIDIDSSNNNFISGNIQFEEKDIPLHEGLIFSRSGEVASYENGVLKYQSRQGNGPFSVLITEIELEVSRDLKEVSSIQLKKIVQPLIGLEKVDTKLTCQF